jgi:hypothetical protein
MSGSLPLNDRKRVGANVGFNFRANYRGFGRRLCGCITIRYVSATAIARQCQDDALPHLLNLLLNARSLSVGVTTGAPRGPDAPPLSPCSGPSERGTKPRPADLLRIRLCSRKLSPELYALTPVETSVHRILARS